jgi:NAD(P)-dependent dehydrogenase (short-subunit alcohol dehydrogenase family)
MGGPSILPISTFDSVGPLRPIFFISYITVYHVVIHVIIEQMPLSSYSSSSLVVTSLLTLLSTIINPTIASRATVYYDSTNFDTITTNGIRSTTVVPTPTTNTNTMSSPSSFLSDFLGYEGKVALVTGSTAGLGRAIAEVLLQAGCTVVVNGRNDERTQKVVDDMVTSCNVADKSRVLAAAGDTSDSAAAKVIVEKIRSTYNRLDILVNNAGINLPEGSFQDQYSPDNWNKISRVNIEGPMNMSHEALALIKASPAGRIINVSSMIGHVGDANNPLYTMTKAAMLLFTKSLAADMAGKPDSQNVTVNSISPGVFSTDMNAKFTSDSNALAQVEEGIPMRRLGQPKELAGAVLYLASDTASYTTGCDIVVDGGFVAV